MFYTIINETKKKIVVSKAKIAKTFFSRLMGFMFRKRIDTDEALIFYFSPSIHTFFMCVPIDIVFLNKSMRVIKIKTALAPWKITGCKNSFVVIELVANKVYESLIEKGDLISFVPNKINSYLNKK